MVKRLVAVTVVTGLMGCATDVPKTPDYFAADDRFPTSGIGRVALVADASPPEIESVDLGQTYGQSAARGAVGGALEGATAALEGLAGCSGGYCGAAFLLLLPVFAVGGAVAGAASGADSGYDPDRLAAAEANARRMLDAAYLQTGLLDRTRDYGMDNLDLEFVRGGGAAPKTPLDRPDYDALAGESIDAVLEVDLLRVALGHSLEMTARARLVSVRTGAVLSDGRYMVSSERRRLEEWLADGAAPVTEAIQRGLQTLAEDMVDENFLLFYPEKPGAIAAADAAVASAESPPPRSRSVPHYVLGPVYPALDHCFFCGEGLFRSRPHRAIGNLEFVAVDSVRPTLRWERFPRAHDLTGGDGRPVEITDVRYDIRVFDTAAPAGDGIVLVPAQQVYGARDLPEAHHTVAGGLAACRDYFWTVRARFKLDGRVRVTEWAGAFDVAGWNEKPWNLRRGRYAYPEMIGPIRVDGPEWFYYPFKTPCD